MRKLPRIGGLSRGIGLEVVGGLGGRMIGMVGNLIPGNESMRASLLVGFVRCGRQEQFRWFKSLSGNHQQSLKRVLTIYSPFPVAWNV
ncbi:hypothetical protein CsSME_00014589 [Camellia sinensis var. sinensis]